MDEAAQRGSGQEPSSEAARRTVVNDLAAAMEAARIHGEPFTTTTTTTTTYSYVTGVPMLLGS